jgi:hypothetical protein
MVGKRGMGAKLNPWFVGAMLAARRPPEALAVVPGHTNKVEAGCHDGHAA